MITDRGGRTELFPGIKRAMQLEAAEQRALKAIAAVGRAIGGGRAPVAAMHELFSAARQYAAVLDSKEDKS
jgi:hypothetical protein